VLIEQRDRSHQIMKSVSRAGWAAASCLALLVAYAGLAAAQQFPAKPVRLVVPYPAGGPVDLIARALGQKLAGTLGQQIVVDNRAGANGIIGVEVVAKAAPDGYTLVMASTSTHSINPAMYKKLPFDAIRDFAPVARLTTRPYVLVVHPSVPAASVRELIALAKSKPGDLTYASGGGNGSGNHLAGELFKTMAGVNILHVPYKGAAPAMTELLGGQVNIMFAPILSALPHVGSGKLRALAVTDLRRAAVAPELPTMAESGLAGFEFNIWDAILAPAGTPAPVVSALNSEIVKILAMPDVQQRFAAMGVVPAGSAPAELMEFMKADAAKWAKVLRDAGVQPE
jgi:tripartite-type tricarboxylate transporter receptor subunit TctC